MVLGIDASNIRSGGGLTHLIEILKYAKPLEFDQVIIWSSNKTLEKLPDRDWLVKESHPMLNRSFVFSFIYQMFFISRLARKKYNCDLIFVPGGTFVGSFKNIVTMCRNMLPFEVEERRRFEDWKSRLRFKVLYYTQSLTFKRSTSIIFLSNYAKTSISNSLSLKNDHVIIPHGVNLSFMAEPRSQRDINSFSKEEPFKLLYVSNLAPYKHQWNVAGAIIKLRAEGYPIKLDLVGGKDLNSLARLNKVLENDIDNIVNYRGLIPYKNLESVYKNADGFIFASSCENMPNILVEAMAAGLPIATSNMGPMPELLEADAFYFNPLSQQEIYTAVKDMLLNTELRSSKVENSYNKFINYTWENCSYKTFEYLYQIAKKL